MLLILGGLFGNGRSVLARRMETQGFHYYSLHDKKPRSRFFDKKGTLHEGVRHTETDEQRVWFYKEAAADFPMLSKLHENVVIEDSMNREKPREFLFAEAKKYFKPVVFVWIESQESRLEPRLRAMVQSGVIPSFDNGMQRYQRAMKEFQPFETSPLVFFYGGLTEQTVQNFNSFLQSIIKRKLSKEWQ